jgi:hypothetical protein
MGDSGQAQEGAAGRPAAFVQSSEKNRHAPVSSANRGKFIAFSHAALQYGEPAVGNRSSPFAAQPTDAVRR